MYDKCIFTDKVKSGWLSSPFQSFYCYILRVYAHAHVPFPPPQSPTPTLCAANLHKCLNISDLQYGLQCIHHHRLHNWDDFEENFVLWETQSWPFRHVIDCFVRAGNKNCCLSTLFSSCSCCFSFLLWFCLPFCMYFYKNKNKHSLGSGVSASLCGFSSWNWLLLSNSSPSVTPTGTLLASVAWRAVLQVQQGGKICSFSSNLAGRLLLSGPGMSDILTWNSLPP